MKLSKSEEFKLINIKAKEQVYTLLSGNHLSKIYGEGYDFGELREYQLGDDIRKINWAISAKMQKPYIKELYANRELSVVVAPIISPSLYFGLEGSNMVHRNKNIITQIALSLGYNANKNQDLFTGVYFFNNQTKITPPTKNRYQIEKFGEKIFNLNPLNSTLDHNKIPTELISKIVNRSIIFLIGDFLEPIDLSILAQKHEVVAVIVRDKDNISKAYGDIVLKNPSNSKEESRFIGKRAIKSYKERLDRHDREMYEHFSRFNVRFVEIN